MTDDNPLNPDHFCDEVDLSPRAVAPPTAPRSRNRKALAALVLTLTVVAGGVIVTQFLSSAIDFFCNVDEIGRRDGCEEDRPIRLQGTVDEGTIAAGSGVTTFTMSHNAETIAVVYDGDPGGIFRECVPVVVHGTIQKGVLQGERLEIKHSDEYVAENDDNLVAAAEQPCGATA